MYESHFGLSTKPFAISPDPKFLFMSEKHSQALALLDYSVSEKAGFAVLTGEIGSGKTLLIRKLLAGLDSSYKVGLVSNSHQSMTSILLPLIDSFGIDPEGDIKDDVAANRRFQKFLIANYASGHNTLVVIDESQNLTVELLEQLRLLSNINTDGHQLLQTILVGQPELAQKLSMPELNQFAQRVSVDYFLGHLKGKEVLDYIDFRVSMAGGDAQLFNQSAKKVVAIATRGIPRLINNLCDLALTYAFANQQNHVSVQNVVKVISDKEKSGVLPFCSMQYLRERIAKK